MDQKKPSQHKRLMLDFSSRDICIANYYCVKMLIDTGMARDLATEQYGIIEPAVDLNASESLKPLTKNGLAPSEWISIYFESGGCRRRNVK